MATRIRLCRPPLPQDGMISLRSPPSLCNSSATLAQNSACRQDCVMTHAHVCLSTNAKGTIASLEVPDEPVPIIVTSPYFSRQLGCTLAGAPTDRSLGVRQSTSQPSKAVSCLHGPCRTMNTSMTADVILNRCSSQCSPHHLESGMTNTWGFQEKPQHVELSCFALLP
jgi:hypothetical protein